MLVIVGSNRSVHCLMMEDGNGSKTQDFEDAVAASSLMSSSFISVKVENLVKDIVSTSSETYSAESIRAFFLTWRSLSGLSLSAGGRGFSPATKRVAPGYFYWKIEEK